MQQGHGGFSRARQFQEQDRADLAQQAFRPTQGAELGVFDVAPEGLKLVELADGVGREEVAGKTGVTLVG